MLKEVNQYFKYGQSLFDTIANSQFAETLSHNWTTCILEEREEADAACGKISDTWTKKIEEDKVYHRQKITGSLFPVETNDWALVKSIGIAYFGAPYYFGAALARDLGTGIYETAKVIYGIYPEYHLSKEDSAYTLRRFLQNRVDQFKVALPHFKQASKDLAVLLPFYFDFELMGLPLFTTLAVSYAAYAPLNVRIHLDKLENWWRRDGVRPLLDHEVKSLSVLQTVKHMTDGSYSLSRLFNMHKIEKPKEA